MNRSVYGIFNGTSSVGIGDRHRHLSNYRSVSSDSSQSGILLGNALLVDFSAIGHRRPHRFRAGKSDSAVDPVGSFLILFFLDHQGGLRTARTRAERLVPNESETEEGI